MMCDSPFISAEIRIKNAVGGLIVLTEISLVEQGDIFVGKKTQEPLRRDYQCNDLSTMLLLEERRGSVDIGGETGILNVLFRI
jgi:hypothetical protein